MDNVLFHILRTKEPVSEDISIQPYLPKTAYENIEGNIPRVCTSTNIFCAIRSIVSKHKVTINDLIIPFSLKENDESVSHWIERNGNFCNIAILATTDSGYLPPDCADFRFNEERWFIKEQSFKLIGYLDLIAFANNQIVILQKPLNINYQMFFNKLGFKLNDEILIKNEY